MNETELHDLIACPTCDALYRARVPQGGETLVCARCHHTLITPRADSFLRVIAFAITAIILMVGAVLFPFLSVDVMGFSNRTSVLDTAFAFMGQGWQSTLVVLVAAFIIAIPMARSGLAIYTLAPLVAGGRPFRHARKAFRLFETLKPWSMAEIFIIGCAVALVKVADLATVGFGPAFWMFIAFVVIVVLQDNLMDRWTIWRAIEARRPVPASEPVLEAAE